MTKGNYKIPFRDGNQMEFEPYCKGDTFEWIDNFYFEDELSFVSYGRGRSSVTFTFRRKSNDKTVSMFVSDFSDAFPFAVGGKLSGKFTFIKKGQNYGCRMVFE